MDNRINEEKKEVKESAAPSFKHPNIIILWFVWQRIRKAIRMSEDINKKNILDFGSGTGVLLPFLNKNLSISAIDLHTTMLKKTIQEFCLKNVNLLKYNNNKIPMKSCSVDFVYALEVFEHIDDMNETLIEIKRVMKKNGYLLYSGPTENIFYKIGRFFSGFKGDYHVVKLEDINNLIKKQFKLIKNSNLFNFLPIYRFYLYQKL